MFGKKGGGEERERGGSILSPEARGPPPRTLVQELCEWRRVFDHCTCWLGRSARLPRFLAMLWHKDVLDLLPAFTGHSNRAFHDVMHGFSVDMLHCAPERRSCGAVLMTSTISFVIWARAHRRSPVQWRQPCRGTASHASIGTLEQQTPSTQRIPGACVCVVQWCAYVQSWLCVPKCVCVCCFGLHHVAEPRGRATLRTCKDSF